MIAGAFDPYAPEHATRWLLVPESDSGALEIEIEECSAIDIDELLRQWSEDDVIHEPRRRRARCHRHTYRSRVLGEFVVFIARGDECRAVAELHIVELSVALFVLLASAAEHACAHIPPAERLELSRAR